MHQLDMEKAQFRIYGKSHTWADEAGLCDSCEQLYRAGDDAGLNLLWDRTWPDADAGVQDLHNSLDAFRRSDVGAIPLSEWWPPGVAELVADGFVPLEDLTGNLEIAAEWPELYRRSVPETRPGWDEVWQDGQCWLVRSPWPSMPVTDVVTLLWRWISAHQPPRSGPVRPEDEEVRMVLVRQFLQADEDWAVAFKRKQSGPG